MQDDDTSQLGQAPPPFSFFLGLGPIIVADDMEQTPGNMTVLWEVREARWNLTGIGAGMSSAERQHEEAREETTVHQGISALLVV